MTSTPSPREPLGPETRAEAAERQRLALVSTRRAALLAKLEANARYARDGYVRPQVPPAARPRLRGRRRASGA